jgi:hypothetical protein
MRMYLVVVRGGNRLASVWRSTGRGALPASTTALAVVPYGAGLGRRRGGDRRRGVGRRRGRRRSRRRRVRGSRRGGCRARTTGSGGSARERRANVAPPDVRVDHLVAGLGISCHVLILNYYNLRTLPGWTQHRRAHPTSWRTGHGKHPGWTQAQSSGSRSRAKAC